MPRRNLSKLAKELAPAFQNVSPADVEDVASLCVWVRKEAGEELTLKQAEKLRILLDAEADKLPKDEVPVSGSFPIYILDLGGKDYTIVFPEGKTDLDHSQFWEDTVARLVARHFRLPLEEVANLVYCQRRARINGQNVLYGEKQTTKLLRLIEKALGQKDMRWVYDEHEQRLIYDRDEFNALCLKS